MLWNTAKRLVREDDGMEMVEWSIVGVVFALAGALIWATLGTSVTNAVQDISNCVETGSCTPPSGGGGGGTP